MFRKSIDQGTVDDNIRSASIVGHLLKKLHSTVKQPVLAESADLRSKRDFIWMAIVPDHLCHELLGFLPLLSTAQALQHGVVGVGVGSHGHGGDEAQCVPEAAGATVSVDECGVGNDVGGAGGFRRLEHALRIGEAAVTAVTRDEGVVGDGVGGARGLECLKHALRVREAAACAELLDEDVAGDDGRGLRHRVRGRGRGGGRGPAEEQPQRGVEVVELDEAANRAVSGSRARRGARIDPDGARPAAPPGWGLALAPAVSPPR